jgi:hypothetical protein
MRLAAPLLFAFAVAAPQPAAAEPFYREDLRIPMEAAGLRGLEAMLLRPDLCRLAKGSFRFPRRAPVGA